MSIFPRPRMCHSRSRGREFDLAARSGARLGSDCERMVRNCRAPNRPRARRSPRRWWPGSSRWTSSRSDRRSGPCAARSRSISISRRRDDDPRRHIGLDRILPRAWPDRPTARVMRLGRVMNLGWEPDENGSPWVDIPVLWQPAGKWLHLYTVKIAGAPDGDDWCVIDNGINESFLVSDHLDASFESVDVDGRRQRRSARRPRRRRQLRCRPRTSPLARCRWTGACEAIRHFPWLNIPTRKPKPMKSPRFADEADWRGVCMSVSPKCPP